MIKRILIVGLGSIGSRHLRLLRGLFPSADIRVLRHQATDQIPEYANGCLHSIDQAIVFTPNIAIIANPATFHIDVATALAQAGVHLLIEKPLSSSAHGIQELIDICKQKKLVLFIGYNLRFFTSLRCFRDFLIEGLVGKVLSVRSEMGQYLPSWRRGRDYRQTVSARHDLGGGVLLELSHELDYLRWIFGEISWVRATLSKQSDLEIDVEDTAHLVLGFMPRLDGYELKATVNLDFIRHDPIRLCTAIGDDGTLRWNGITGQVTLYKNGVNAWKELHSMRPEQDDSYKAELISFVDCVAKSQPPSITAEDGFAVIKIIDAAKKSMLSDGSLIRLE